MPWSMFWTLILMCMLTMVLVPSIPERATN